LIHYVGEADQEQKRKLMAEASCLLAPITWDEPFGLFMAEAMACGTPVIAMNRGSVPEVVQHGVTGFVVEGIDEMCEATHQLDQIDPAACRRHVEDHFSVGAMTVAYLSAYERISELRLDGDNPAGKELTTVRADVPLGVRTDGFNSKRHGLAMTS
jgi:glycosyltransferase involved in cell wall biosynthesis